MSPSQELTFSQALASVSLETSADFFRIAERASTDDASWQSINQTLKQTGAKGKQLFLPLRSTLSGQTTGPGLAELVALIGMEQVRKRFADAARLTEQDR